MQTKNMILEADIEKRKANERYGRIFSMIKAGSFNDHSLGLTAPGPINV